MHRSGFSRPPLGIAVLAATLSLAGCSSLRPTQQAFAPDEYELRHQIRIGDAVRHLDVFATGRHLDARQQRDVNEFGREFAQSGRGAIRVAVPSGGAGGSSVHAVRAALGVNAPMQITYYQADPRIGASPIRLSYMKLQAQVATPCGLWPDDLAGSKDVQTWHNRPYHNLGCAYQSMLAAQVADPVDLVRPRPEGKVDLLKRTKDIETLRKDQDPSTNWRRDDAKIKEAQQ